MADRKTMTLNLSEDEMNLLEELCARSELSKTAVLRKALRIYHVLDVRLQRGEKLFVENEIENKKAELLVL